MQPGRLPPLGLTNGATWPQRSSDPKKGLVALFSLLKGPSPGRLGFACGRGGYTLDPYEVGNAVREAWPRI
eukprot:33684-Alexandrium_andersonii.AAC.1